MNDFLDRLKPIIISLRPETVDLMPFWKIFEKWMHSLPNSHDDKSCMEQMRTERIFKNELLLAYHMIDNCPLKTILEERINNCRISQEEWQETAHACLGIAHIRRRR